MIKKILMLLALCVPLFAVAQTGVGNWRYHPSFVGTDVTNVIDAGEYVYYLTAGNLFRYDKTTSENESLNKVNYLSSMSISQIYYNSDKDYVLVTYDDSNIDIIQSDGSIINMPEIKDAVLTSSKTINDVTFASGAAYVATDFGYVVINDDKFVVKESRIWNTSLSSVAQIGNFLVLAKDSVLYYGIAGEYYESLESFSVLTKGYNYPKLRPISDVSFFAVYNGILSLYTLATTGTTLQVTSSSQPLWQTVTSLQRTPTGFLLNVPSHKCYYTADVNGNNLKQVDSGGEIFSCDPDGDGTLWAVGAKGLHVNGDNDNYYKPNALSFAKPFWLAYNETLDLLYVSTTATNHFFTENTPTAINTYDANTWTDVTPDSMPANGSYWINFDKDDANTYYLGGWTSGLHKITNNKRVLTYDASNSPMLKKSGAMHPITSVDRNGNLWVVQSLENPTTPVMVLPAAKTKLDKVSAADWITPAITSVYTNKTKRASFLSTTHGSNDIKVFTDGDYNTAITLWNSAGDATDTKPTTASYPSFTDQDGSKFSWTYTMCIAEDLNGTIWMGFKEGVISFNPANAFNSNFTINHIKVPRNDGTGMADYLLDGIQVNSIAVDGANRKWLATETSGLFLVSSDGSEIISKFNTSNSPLASNTVYRVCCNPNSNSVYITTPEGVYEYFSDSSPAMSDYSNIYAYPNPVRPEYTGLLTITGLMDNSLIKIADAGGNVIKQLKSTGGMTTWDCCDENGDSVKSGIYFIICSRADGGNEAVVSKVAIIR